MAEALGRSIKALQQDSHWVGVNVAIGIEKMTHLQFANDTILFGSACRREARTRKNFLDDYYLASGQKINWHKSEVFFVNTPLNLQATNPRVGVIWEAPEVGWSKVNFDGASTGNPGQTGIGCILRDSDGLCIKEISEKIGVATNNEVEFRVTLRGLQLGKELGVQKIHLEADSLNVINVIHCNSIPSWHLNQWIQSILALLATFDEFWISHIYREGNGEADRLLKLALVISDPS
ncbi:uncharacterized protein LOC131874981 [Cryptomeria japonica]|uniref:uncharacterized protein LOC131874981 n=1 Tax=Cryptomeria japonica TaxID=3369 RepID=UPI0027DA483F|nr:uncharacterized protein LOC131874981 [Cryptomeria japonica]